MKASEMKASGTRRVDILGVPMDLGADRRGVDMGPSAIRYARLHERLREQGVSEILDRGNLVVPDRDIAKIQQGDPKYFGLIQSVCDVLADSVEKSVKDGAFPLVLGGDHSIAIGTLAGLRRARGEAPGLIWFDAHADINSPKTSPSGNVHGMPVYYAVESGDMNPKRSVLIGLRDVDPGERTTIRELGISAFTMTDIDRLGMEAVVARALEIAGAGPVHVSFDMDAIDPSEAPGVGTPVKGGITYREAHLALEEIAASGRLGSLEITEINPILDSENRTASLAVELILSALGKTIL
jgi:arginase